MMIYYCTSGRWLDTIDGTTLRGSLDQWKKKKKKERRKPYYWMLGLPVDEWLNSLPHHHHPIIVQST